MIVCCDLCGEMLLSESRIPPNSLPEVIEKHFRNFSMLVSFHMGSKHGDSGAHTEMLRVMALAGAVVSMRHVKSGAPENGEPDIDSMRVEAIEQLVLLLREKPAALIVEAAAVGG